MSSPKAALKSVERRIEKVMSLSAASDTAEDNLALLQQLKQALQNILNKNRRNTISDFL